MLAAKQRFLQLFSITDLQNELANKKHNIQYKHGTKLKIPDVNVPNIPSSIKTLH
jgi:hypothetical protein